jgi:hypothetical protein
VILQITFRGEEVIDYAGVDEETYEALKNQLNAGKLEFIELENAEGIKFLINKSNILMMVLKPDKY